MHQITNVLSVPTHLGHLQFERHADGGVLASLGGKHWFEINQSSQALIAGFLAKENNDDEDVHEVTVSFKPQISKEGGGWGVNVSPSIRYVYSSRNNARLANIHHLIGNNGRIS